MTHDIPRSVKSVNRNPRFDLLRELLGVSGRELARMIALDNEALPVVVLHIPRPDGSANLVGITGEELARRWEETVIKVIGGTP